ncbi:MAG TPA: IS66 family transposase [Candidatus Sulfotelmatobacter sp.]|nr:IS66 family transposase [Candidatus Sulfotelmatobacter sp.]
MPIDALSDDLDALRALVARLSDERDAATEACRRLTEQNERIRHLLRQLQRGRFGQRSERLDGDQMQLALEDVETAVAKADATGIEAEAPASGERKAPRRANRGSLPSHLPRIHVTLAPETTVCPCCNGVMHVIGEDETKRLDVIPAQYRVIVTHRPKYGCRACEGAVVQAAAPEHLIKAGMPTEALVAAVLIGKYAWHNPLYRQAQIMALRGLPIDRSTLAAWVGCAAAELDPVYMRLKQILLGSAKIVVDETRAPVLDPGRGRTKSGYFWAISRDDRPWCGADPPAVVYSYAPGRGAIHGAALLKDYSGIIQCDGYAAYKSLANPAREGGPITLAFCWAHWRRKFVEIDRGGGAPIAHEALERIAALYAVETRIRGRGADQRRAVRQAESLPLVAALRAWLDAQLRAVSAKSAIAEAIRYGLNHWDGLVRFLDDGRLELDTNSVERAMRPIALSRKNSLFAGHDQGAVNWACVASLIETAKLHGIDPQAYLADILTKLVNGWPMARLDALMPWAWASADRNAMREGIAA